MPSRWSVSCWKAAGQHALALHGDGVAVQVHAGDAGVPVPADREAQARDGEAALDLVGLEVLAVFQHGVDDVSLDAADAVGEDALADTDLGCGQARAVHVLHGFGHVGDKLRQLRPEFRHGIGNCAQHRITDDADIQNGHVQSVLTVGGDGIQSSLVALRDSGGPAVH